MRYGISAVDFPYTSPRIVNVYREEYERKAKEKAELIDIMAWKNGMYIRSAIGSCIDKKCKYPEKPLSFNEKASEEEKSASDAMMFEAWAISFNQNRKKRGELSVDRN